MAPNAFIQRENEEMNLRKLRTQAELETKRLVSSLRALPYVQITLIYLLSFPYLQVSGIQTVSNYISNSIAAIVSRPDQLLMIGGIILLFIFAYYSIKEFVRFPLLHPELFLPLSPPL
jgi:uncharacterized membrane protein YesL